MVCQSRTVTIFFADNAWFRRNFGDLRNRYGIRSVLQGAFYPYQTLEEKWGFAARLASRTYFDAAPGRAMRDLRDLLAGKETFVLTTNADDSFQLAGFDPSRVFAMEGGHGNVRCSAHCTNEVRKDLDALERMAAAETDGRVPTETIPRCEHCGSPMEPNLMTDDSFFQTPFRQAQAAAFTDFVRRHAGGRIVVLEIGAGPRNGLLLQPMRSLAVNEQGAKYVILNLETPAIPPALSKKTMALPGDLGTTLEALKAA